MPTTVSEVLDELKDKEAVAKLTGLVIGVHANRFVPKQKQSTQGKGGTYWSAFLPVTIRGDNRVVDVNITWPVSKEDGSPLEPLGLIQTGMELKVLQGNVSEGRPKDDGGKWPNAVWTKLSDIRLDGAESAPAGNGVPAPTSPPSQAPASPGAPPVAQKPAGPVRTFSQVQGFIVSMWEEISTGIPAEPVGGFPAPSSEDLAHLVGIALTGYLNGRIE